MLFGACFSTERNNSLRLLSFFVSQNFQCFPQFTLRRAFQGKKIKGLTVSRLS